MADLTKDELKAIFKAGAIPTEAQFASLIESQVNKKDTGSLILSASSIDISGSAIAKTDIDLLKQGKSISSPTITSGSTSDEDNVDYTQYLRPEAIISDTDTSTYTKYTVPGKIGTFVSGVFFHQLDLSGSNNIAKTGNGTTNFIVSGNITSSGNVSSSGGSLYGRSLYLDATLIHSGDEDTKMTFGSDNITFNVGTIPLLTLTEDTQNSVVIGNSGDVDFQVKSGETNALFVQGSSGNTGLGLNNPGEKLTVNGNVSASGNLVVGGTSTFNDEVTIAKLEKLYFDGPSGLHIYSEGTAPGENQIILAKTNNLRILNQAHGKNIEFGTENASGTAKTPLILSGSGDAIFGGNLTVTNNISASGQIIGTIDGGSF